MINWVYACMSHIQRYVPFCTIYHACALIGANSIVRHHNIYGRPFCFGVITILPYHMIKIYNNNTAYICNSNCGRACMHVGGHILLYILLSVKPNYVVYMHNCMYDAWIN